MPLLGNGDYKEPSEINHSSEQNRHDGRTPLPGRRQSQHSVVAKTAILSQCITPNSDGAHTPENEKPSKDETLLGIRSASKKLSAPQKDAPKGGRSIGAALSDTPATTAPNSPVIPPRRQDSGSSTPRHPRPTTLDIPGLTKSKVSPDGKIAQRDVGSKLVIVMVGLPARGKSYVTKKIARYLNWLQHDTKIFNVGERRRVVAAGVQSSAKPIPLAPRSHEKGRQRKISNAAISLNEVLSGDKVTTPPPSPSTRILVNGELPNEPTVFDALPPSAMQIGSRDDSDEEGEEGGDGRDVAKEKEKEQDVNGVNAARLDERMAALQMPPPPLMRNESMDQTASFFDPNNERAAKLREEVAMATLDELLDYILEKGGSVGIFDATNSTLERRKLIVEKVRERAGPELGILFLESLCIDETLLESNMRLKLSGPDYRDQDPVVAFEDFKKRVALYEKKYVPLGKYEEDNNMPYVQMIDVGRKVVSHQIRGFLSAQTVYYLLNFNLAPRQIWITRHGESIDNVQGKIGGDSDLSDNGRAYAKALTRFIKHQRKAWEVYQKDKLLSTHFPPQAGDTTPPNPEYTVRGEDDDEDSSKPFCIWTSMLKRSVQTAQYFDEEEFDMKEWKMLDELNAGNMEGMTYDEIRTKHSEEYELRKADKLHYRYPGAGGEGYLDVINRLRAVIVEAERMTDHLLFVGHRSVARVLLAYFKGLKREDVADLDVPLGMLYMLEPKPYGVEFKALRYNPTTDWFDHIPDYELRRASHPTVA